MRNVRVVTDASNVAIVCLWYRMCRLHGGLVACNVRVSPIHDGRRRDVVEWLTTVGRLVDIGRCKTNQHQLNLFKLGVRSLANARVELDSFKRGKE